MSNSLQPHGLYSPWYFPGQNTGVGSLFLLQQRSHIVEPHEQYEKANNNSRTVNYELPRSLGAQYATGEEWRNNTGKNEEREPK